jgi:colicin import membrane protein
MPKPVPKETVRAEIELKERQRKLEQKKQQEKEAELARRKEAEARKEEDRRKQQEDKERRAQERKDKEEARKQEEARKREEQARAEELRKQEEAQRKEEEQRQDEARREQEQRLRREAEQAVAARARELQMWTERIRARIKQKVVVTPGVPDTVRAEFTITIIPGGEVLSVKLKKGSGYPAYDMAVERAIYAAMPLPVPSDPQLFQQMRELTVTFRP